MDASVLNLVWMQIANAFNCLFVDWELPWGVTLGMFVVACSLLHFILNKLLPFLGGGASADRASDQLEKNINRYGF